MDYRHNRSVCSVPTRTSAQKRAAFLDVPCGQSFRRECSKDSRCKTGNCSRLCLPIFLLIDLLWLGVVMKGFYSQELGELARRARSGSRPPLGRGHAGLSADSRRHRSFRAATPGRERHRLAGVRLGGVIRAGAVWRVRPDKSRSSRKMDGAHDFGRHGLGLRPVRHDQRRHEVRGSVADEMTHHDP